MSKYELLERLFFTMIVVGILASVFGAVKYFDISNQIANNQAAQIKATGEEVTLETKNEAQGLMAADLELRRLVRERSNMITVGGVGLALLGAGWILTDIIRNRRKKEAVNNTVAEMTS